MTFEEHLKQIIGEMAMRIAQLQAQVEELKAKLADKDAVR